MTNYERAYFDRMYRKDGLRHITQYQLGGFRGLKDGVWHEPPYRWALYELKDGKAKRMGTARTQEEADLFLSRQ